MDLLKSFINTAALTFAVILGFGGATLTLVMIWIMISRMTGALNTLGVPM